MRFSSVNAQMRLQRRLQKVIGLGRNAMVSENDNLQELSRMLEAQHPGETIVLNATTREVIVISKIPLEVSQKIKNLAGDIVTVFIGGPHTGRELAFHHFLFFAKDVTQLGEWWNRMKGIFGASLLPSGVC
jgi:hypothetical protein